MPDVNGNLVEFTASQVLNTEAPPLSYTYDDLSDPLAGTIPTRARFAARTAAPTAVAAATVMNMSAKNEAELIGANEGVLNLRGIAASTQVRIDRPAARSVKRRSATAMAASSGASVAEPDRVYLNLESIKGNNDAVILDVYVNLPQAVAPADHPELHAGVVGLFGVQSASSPDGDHAGNGVTHVMDITHIVDTLTQQGGLADQPLSVRLVPRNPLTEEDDISVGRVSVYREKS